MVAFTPSCFRRSDFRSQSSAKPAPLKNNTSVVSLKDRVKSRVTRHGQRKVLYIKTSKESNLACKLFIKIVLLCLLFVLV